VDRNTKLPARYNELTQLERRAVRQQCIRIQNGMCSHCNVALDGDPSEEIRKMSINLKLFPPNFLHHPVHLHHSHETGMIIGAVHARCNAVLWQYYGE
jgi:hypothetical protein